MNIYLPDYCFGNQMLMVARNEAVYQELMCRNCDTMFSIGQVMPDRPMIKA